VSAVDNQVQASDGKDDPDDEIAVRLHLVHPRARLIQMPFRPVWLARWAARNSHTSATFTNAGRRTHRIAAATRCSAVAMVCSPPRCCAVGANTSTPTTMAPPVPAFCTSWVTRLGQTGIASRATKLGWVEMTGQPELRVTSVTIGAPDPRALAAFYARLLGWTVTTEEPARPGSPPEDGWAQMGPPPGKVGPTLNFEYEAAYDRPVWPSEAGQQHITQHLDIHVDDLNEAVAWALSAGAELASFQPQEHVRVLLDPAGHPFCLFL